jgi:hypothetical protein
MKREKIDPWSHVVDRGGSRARAVAKLVLAHAKCPDFGLHRPAKSLILLRRRGPQFAAKRLILL